MKIKILKQLTIVFLMTTILNADTTTQIKKEFNNTFENIIKIVKDKSLAKEQRNQKIVNAISPIFDFELMAKLSLGKVWKSLKKDDKKAFVDAYVSRMKKSYSSKIDGFSDEKVVIKNIKQIKANRIMLYSTIIANNEAIKINYKYYKAKSQKTNKKSWLIYDVTIKGISIIKTDRTQFKAILKRESIKTLIEKMKK